MPRLVDRDCSSQLPSLPRALARDISSNSAVFLDHVCMYQEYTLACMYLCHAARAMISHTARAHGKVLPTITVAKLPRENESCSCV